MDNRLDAQRAIVALLIIVITVGGIAFVVFLLGSSAGFLPGIGSTLTIVTLGLTCLLCYPLVFAYWWVSGRPIGLRHFLIVHGMVLAGFVTWYLMLVSDSQ